MTAESRPAARCLKLLREISRYLDGDVTPARQRTIEQHLAACAGCAMLTVRLRRTVAACRAEQSARLPRAVISRAKARVESLLANDGSRAASTPRRRHRNR